ncbi:hypothetical protein GQ61_01685 [Candidatus Nucleicultrix amoebiphila FS5]|uniref:N-acetyltransferase domain-containing protein n=2 Tax=Candidatus Nucleicultrix TaxID=1509243 RepID=A0A1W6N315_9PROT|nr:hypothetical protein GQ61_01685 [Candidatus Nucleicultrix amoebiphila FS5]
MQRMIKDPNIENGRHLVDHFRYIATSSHQLEFQEKGNFIAISSREGPKGGNYILGVGEDKTEFQYFIETFKQKKCSFTWFSTPLTPQLEMTLQAFGLEKANELIGLSFNLDNFVNVTQPSDDIRIKEVRSTEDFVHWCTVHATVWNKSLENTLSFFQGFHLNLDKPEIVRLFVSEMNGHCVGSSALYMQDDIAGCYWGAVLPDYRKKGLATLMLEKRLQVAQAQGCKKVVAQCLPSSKKIFQKSGFLHECDFALYRYKISQENVR